MKNGIQQLFLASALLALFTFNLQPVIAHAQGTAFTYQGRLLDDGHPASGNYDLRFTIYDAVTNGSVIAGPVTNLAVSVSNGLFVVQMDFGNVFDGNPRWVEIGARTNSGSVFTTLTPRQPLLPTPYAIMAGSASNLLGSLPAAQLSGTVSNAVLPASADFPGTVTAASFSGDGANLTNVNAAALNGLNATNFWQLGGNRVAPGQFLGSTNDQPVEIWVNGQRALRLEPDPSGQGAPNVIGGSPVNYVSHTVIGATIGGGGATNFIGFNSSYSETNSVTANFGTVSGGERNTASGEGGTVGGGALNNAGYYATVSGGSGNSASGGTATIGGGNLNVASGSEATIGGGWYNVVGVGGQSATLSGGYYNTANGPYATVGGGDENSASGSGATVGGGGQNVASDFAATVSGGFNNTASGRGAFIGGGGYDGAGNKVQAENAAIVGGMGNLIQTNADYAFIGGGYDNTASAVYTTAGGGSDNAASGNSATVAGGNGNTASGAGSFVGGGGNDGYTADGNASEGNAAAIVGGLGNVIQSSAWYSFIGGGLDNQIQDFAAEASIGGGYQNTNAGEWAVVGGGSGNAAINEYAALIGGLENVASGSTATVGGGSYNTASGNGATVPGGYGNLASGRNSFAAGSNAHATNDGAFVWSDGSAPTSDSTNSQFVARASGGFVFYTSATNTGVTLPPGSGSWSSLSDRNTKDDFGPVNSKALLTKVASLPMSTWSYKTESGVRHIGPMAQDFYAAFKVGEDNKHIADVDEGGVALAAIQGLNQKVNTENAALRTQNAQLQREVENLRRIVAQLSQKLNGDAHTTMRKPFIRTANQL